MAGGAPARRRAAVRLPNRARRMASHSSRPPRGPQTGPRQSFIQLSGARRPGWPRGSWAYDTAARIARQLCGASVSTETVRSLAARAGTAERRAQQAAAAAAVAPAAAQPPAPPAPVSSAWQPQQWRPLGLRSGLGNPQSLVEPALVGALTRLTGGVEWA